MDKKILIWLMILVALIATLGYMMTQENKVTATTTTTTLSGASTSSLQTTTRLIIRPTQPTTTKKGATTIQATTTTLKYGASTTTTTIADSNNTTTESTTTTTHPGTQTDATTTTTITTQPDATTTTIAGATTTTQTGATTTTQTGATTTTVPGATTTTLQDATTTTTVLSTTTTTAAASTTTTTTTTSTTSTTLAQLSAPALYLKFDESAGSTAYDGSVGGNDATLKNGPTWVTGRIGNAIRFDGINDYVDAGSSSTLDITGPITIMVWVNPASAQEICYPDVGQDHGIASKVTDAYGTTTMWSWQLRYGAGTDCQLGFQFNDPVNGERVVDVGQALSPGQWYHVAATFDGSTVRSYLNGVLKESASMSSIRSYPSTKIIIGSDGWSNYFVGSVDDFRVYKRALSATEINQIISAAGTTTTKATTTTTTTATTKATTTTTKATTTTTKTTTTTATTKATTTTTKAATTTTRASTTGVYAADYGVGSTAGDETQFNLNAIAAAAASSSKTLIYPAGKATIITGFIRFPDGLTVVGNGCTIKRGNIGSHAGQMISVGSGGSGAEVYGLIYDGNSFGVHSAGDGILLNDNSYFHDNEVKNVREYSVNVYGADNVRITNNIIHDGLQYGICTGGGDEGGRSHNIVVTGNTIYNMMEVGIKIRGTTGATITGNTVTMGDSPQDGGDTESHHTTVRGISLYSYDHTNDNILIQDNTVSGPYEGYDGDAISSDPPSNTNIRILNNRVSKCSIGIDVRFTGGTITGNTISDCSTCISGGSGNTVTGNTCT